MTETKERPLPFLPRPPVRVRNEMQKLKGKAAAARQRVVDYGQSVLCFIMILFFWCGPGCTVNRMKQEDWWSGRGGTRGEAMATGQ